jgi:3-methyladenine DNA glycosylase AlkC
MSMENTLEEKIELLKKYSVEFMILELKLIPTYTEEQILRLIKVYEAGNSTLKKLSEEHSNDILPALLKFRKDLHAIEDEFITDAIN